MKSIKYIAGSLVILFAFNVFAGDKDYVFSIYGLEAKQHFDKSPKITSRCTYAQNEVDANGKLVDSLKLVFAGYQINSILCRELGVETYACEANTGWYSGPCITD